MRNYGDYGYTYNPHDDYMHVTGNTLRHRDSPHSLWGKHLQCTMGPLYNFADGRICVIPSFKSRHSFFNEYFSHCFSNSVYIQAHTGKLLNIISSQFRNACWVKWHSQIIHSLTTFNKWWGHHHHTFKKEYCHWQVYDFRNWTVHKAVF